MFRASCASRGFLCAEMVQENTEKGAIYHKLRHLRGRHMTRFVNTDVQAVANLPPPPPSPPPPARTRSCVRHKYKLHSAMRGCFPQSPPPPPPFFQTGCVNLSWQPYRSGHPVRRSSWAQGSEPLRVRHGAVTRTPASLPSDIPGSSNLGATRCSG